MFIMNKDRNALINLHSISSIYIGADSVTVKADFENGKGCQLGRYLSEKESKIAIGIVSEKLGKNEVCYMPEDSDVKAKINLNRDKQYHIQGKKTKGHGGS